MLEYVDCQRLNVDRQLIAGAVKSIVDDMTSAANSNYLAAKLLLQAVEHVVLAFAVDTAKVGVAVVSRKSTHFLGNVPASPSPHQLATNCFRFFVCVELHGQFEHNDTFLLIKASSHHWEHLVGVSI